MNEISIHLFAVRLALSVLFGFAIGLERQWRQRMAGTRTNALVCAGASVFVMSGFLIHGDASALGRVVSYVVSGVGFLGAGVIFKENMKVRGMNTAATIWCSAATGVVTALGYAGYAALVVLVVLLTNTVLRGLASRTLDLLSDETITNSRAVQKIRANEQGWKSAVDRLISCGVQPRRLITDLWRWLNTQQPKTTRTVRHHGNRRHPFPETKRETTLMKEQSPKQEMEIAAEDPQYSI